MYINDHELDLHLIEAVKKGNKQAFDSLVVKYQFRVYKVVARYIRNHAEIMDITQETFIKAYKAIDKFRGDSAFYTWLYRIAINTAKNFILTQGRRLPDLQVSAETKELFLSRHTPKEEGTPERLILKDEIEKAVYDVIDELPSELKTTILLREMDGLSYDEIAKTMECPVGTVRSRISRAREAIEKRVNPLLRP